MHEHVRMQTTDSPVAALTYHDTVCWTLLCIFKDWGILESSFCRAKKPQNIFVCLCPLENVENYEIREEKRATPACERYWMTHDHVQVDTAIKTRYSEFSLP